MPPTVYVETTILGYLTARPTRDLVATARQQVGVTLPPRAPDASPRAA